MNEIEAVDGYSDPNPTIEADAPPLHVTANEFDPARHDGKLTLVSPRSGDHRTFRIRTIHRGNLAGSRAVELLTGPDNGEFGSWTMFAFISDGRATSDCPAGTVCVWKRYRGDEREPSIYEQYADLLNRSAYWSGRGVKFMISLKCRRCGRDLTVPSSLADGYGPVCRQKAMGA